MNGRGERAMRHLALALARLRPTLIDAAERRAELNRRLHPPGTPAHCISDEEARARARELAVPAVSSSEVPDHQVACDLELLREAARAAEQPLPLDALAAHAALTPFEVDCLVLA